MKNRINRKSLVTKGREWNTKGQAGIEWIHLFLTCLLVHLTFMASLYKSCFTEASPSFGISKKTGDIQIVTDFRELNKWVEVDPFPLPPRINEETLHKLEKFKS